MIDLMSMGNYTVYVWSSVGVVCTVMAMMAWRAHIQFKHLRKAIAWSKKCI